MRQRRWSLLTVNIVLVVVVNSSQVEQVLFGEQGVVGHLAPSSLIIQCATRVPSQAKQLGERVAAEGLMMLDAPISGGAGKRKAVSYQLWHRAPQAFSYASDVLDGIAARSSPGDDPAWGPV